MTLRHLSLAAAAIVFATIPTAFAQDAMAPAGGAMMSGDAMAPMSDDDLKLCLEQAAGITFAQAMEAATAACHGMHNGMMGDAMAPDAMAPADAMVPADAMAPTTK